VTQTLKPDTVDPSLLSPPQGRIELAFGETRNSLNRQFTYLLISQRARGLCLGVNMNPDRQCNFKCVYCEVARDSTPQAAALDVGVMAAELRQMLQWVQEEKVAQLPAYRTLPEELLQFRLVVLSGNGEPTLCPNFDEAVRAVVQVRAQTPGSFFKIVLVTNATGLHLPVVQQGLRALAPQDEVWAKLDAGTPEHLRRINRTDVPLDQILSNIRQLGRQRPVILQSLFPLLDGQEPPAEEIRQYVERLAGLKRDGTMISLVQIYSAHRPTPLSGCRHLSLRSLSAIAQQVKAGTGLPVEVF